MTTFVIDQDTSGFSITLKPGPPGLAFDVSGVQGSFDATITADGAVDLDAPLDGRFEMDVRRLDLGNRVLTFGAKRFLSGGLDDASVVGELVEARSDDGRTFDADLVLHVRGRSIPVHGTCVFDAGPDGTLRVTGGAVCDPRAFGVALPPLVRPDAHVRWDLHLAAVPAELRGAA
ncbi:MAG: hypothetical protein R2726_16490 [Acidimicrobiales bacterium]